MNSPDPDLWRATGRIDLTRQADGSYSGKLWTGTQDYFVQNWVRGPSGVVTFDWQCAADSAWLDAFISAKTSKISAG